MEASRADPVQPAAALSPWETSTIQLFIRAASLIGLPRSVGEIYGFLFCAQSPQTFDDLSARLGISRGSVSQGLKFYANLARSRCTIWLVVGKIIISPNFL
jgi:HTH-type transcriptional regulator, glycine betaine synthesis regulator